MADYQKMYAILCGAVDDALMGLEQGSSAACIALRLRLALERAEEIYLETSMCAERRGDTNLIELRRETPEACAQKEGRRGFQQSFLHGKKMW